MANFRETLWFKKGELDAQAAQDPEGPGAADLLPVEDRYQDDGSVAHADTASFGVHTGQTQGLEMLKVTTELQPVGDVPTEIVGELKRGRLPVIAAIGASVVAIAAIAFLL